MKNNLDVMREVELIINETGDNLDKLDKHVKKSYEHVKDASKELN
jgi:hypothetical protein